MVNDNISEMQKQVESAADFWAALYKCSITIAITITIICTTNINLP